jgi:hypothetical protein
MLFFYYLFYVTNLVLNIDMHFKSYLFLFLLPKVIESAVKIGYNVFGLCVRAGFGARNCQPAPNFDRSTNLQLTITPPLAANGS